jgi:diguanylate cyclase (GGDEF)-like protein/PAS domain S-box-containing protein
MPNNLQRSGLMTAARWLAFGGMIVLCSAYTLGLTSATDSVVTVWITNGILVGTLMRLPTRRWLPCLAIGYIALFAARSIFVGPSLFALSMATANMIEVLIVAVAIRRRFVLVTAQTPFLELGRVATVSTLVGCAVSGVLASIILHIETGASVWTVLDNWYRAHVLGMVIVATLTLVTLSEGRRMLGLPGKRRQFLLTMGIVVAVTLVVLSQSQSALLFLVYPPLLWAVFRHRFSGLVSGIGLLTLITSVAVAVGAGPFAPVPGTHPAEHALLAQLFVGVACLITLPVSLALAQRGRLAARVRESEMRYRTLAANASDLVMRVGADGARLYVSPSVEELLGWTPEEFSASRDDLIHPDDRARVIEAIAALWRTGGLSTTTYRIRHKSGHYAWLEALVRRVPSQERSDAWELVYSGRDVSKRIAAEQALADSDLRLRTITNNVPAVIAHVDADERYTFVNDDAQRISGSDPATMIGRTVREVGGETIYGEIKGPIATVLAGEAVIVDYEGQLRGQHHYFQSNFVPDRDIEGHVRGFYALTTDITRIKLVEQELSRLARIDPLTGLANRRHFDEHIALALGRAQRVLLMIVDVDHFKTINDTWGHGVGDDVLREVGQRIQACLRKNDLVARIGGDEFVVLVEDIDSPIAADLLARKVLAAMALCMAIGSVQLPVHVSMGVALCAGPSTADEIMHIADGALYVVKAAGGGSYRLVARAM